MTVKRAWMRRCKARRATIVKTYRVKSCGELVALLGRHQREREKSLLAAVGEAAKAGVLVIKRRVPVAFGELRESVHAELNLLGAAIVIDAPHAVDVETGSRPHTPPLAALVEWVKLRGAQGLLTTRQVGRLPGTTTARQARSIASTLGAMERGGALDVDAPERIARAIQKAIALRGTKPHWYARGALPDLHRILAAAIKDALAKAP
jgi:hypothetical protein